MYIVCVKQQKKSKYPVPKSSAVVLKEGVAADGKEEGPMVRTQIYLSKDEYDFVQREASRRDEPMAAVIRRYIDEKIDDAWTNNPILKPWPHDPNWKSPPDAAMNLDHYLYGVPKDYIKVNGKYVEAPPLPKDYYDNPASRKAYDKMVQDMDETK